MGAAGAESQSTPVAPILLAMVAGAIVGWLVRYFLGPEGAIGHFQLVPFFDLVGTMFINLLKMIIVPLIMASVITGVAALGSGPDLGRLGSKTLAFYVLTTLIAVLIALFLVNLVEPGVKDGQPVGDKLALTTDSAAVTSSVKARADASVLDTIKGIVPPNIVEAAANTKLLAIVFFSVIFGFFLARIGPPHQATMMSFWQGMFQIMMRITGWVMTLAPIGVFALIAKVVAVSGFEGAGPLLQFAACVVAGLAVYAFVALPLLIRSEEHTSELQSQSNLV